MIFYNSQLCRGSFILRARLHGGGGPQVSEVTCGGLPLLSCTHDQIKMRDYMDRRVTPPERVTSPTWGPYLHVNRPLIMESTTRTLLSPLSMQGKCKSEVIKFFFSTIRLDKATFPYEHYKSLCISSVHIKSQMGTPGRVSV